MGILTFPSDQCPRTQEQKADGRFLFLDLAANVVYGTEQADVDADVDVLSFRIQFLQLCLQRFGCRAP